MLVKEHMHSIMNSVCVCVSLVWQKELLSCFGEGRGVNIITYHRTCFELCGLVFVFCISIVLIKHTYNVYYATLIICKFLDCHSYKLAQWYASISWHASSYSNAQCLSTVKNRWQAGGVIAIDKKIVCAPTLVHQIMLVGGGLPSAQTLFIITYRVYRLYDTIGRYKLCDYVLARVYNREGGRVSYFTMVLCLRRASSET